MVIRAGRLYFVLVLLILAGAVTLRIADPFFVQALRLIAFDSYQRLGPATYDPDSPVRVVDIDEVSLSRIGQWPWSRTIMADLTNRLAAAGAAAIAFDILFPEPDQTSLEQALKRLPPEQSTAISDILAGNQSHDSIFAQAISGKPAVVATALTTRSAEPPLVKAGFAVAGDDPLPFIADFSGATRNLAPIDEAATGIGSINWTPDRDQIIRRVPLVYRVGEQFVPTLSMEALRVVQGASTYVLKASNASGETAFGEETGLNHIKVGDIEIPTDADGAIWLRFRPKNEAAYVPAWKALAGEVDQDEIAGRIVLIGTSAPGLLDLRATPLDSTIAGVEVHAQAIEHILAGRSLTRPDYALAAELAIILALGLALSLVMPRISARASAALGLAVVALMFVGGWYAYDRLGLLFDPTFPALTLLVLVAAATLYIYRRVELQRGEMRRAFSQYVSPAVVNEIIADPSRLELGGEVRELTLMFSDVRNFTSISERMSANELTHFINTLLTPLSDIILKQRGTIDKYMGDGIMAFWNAPLTDADHAVHACQSALQMVSRIETLNDAWRKEAEKAGRQFQKVMIGIGLNTGDCCVGNLGSRQRFDYSAIGDNVNVASRLEGLSKLYGVPIVVGEPTVKRSNGLATLELDLMRVKGREQPTRVYTLTEALRIKDSARSGFEDRHNTMLEAYRTQDWDAAERALVACRAAGVIGLETLYQLYFTRIVTYREIPPPADWDGAVTAENK